MYKLLTQSSFGVIQQHKARGGTWMFHYCVTRLTVVEGQGPFTKCGLPRGIPPVV